MWGLNLMKLETEYAMKFMQIEDLSSRSKTKGYLLLNV
jgi:hypothetical protein